MWESLGNFAKSGLGQTAIGAGLGYGIDKLAGGKGGTGALLGGAGGLMNFGSGGGFGEGGFNMDDSYLGQASSGLFGTPAKQVAQKGVEFSNNPVNTNALLGGSASRAVYNPQGASALPWDADIFANTPTFETAVAQGYTPEVASKGLLGGLADKVGGFAKEYKEPIGLLKDTYGIYSDVTEGQERAKLNKANVDAIRGYNMRQQSQFDQAKENQAITQAGANEAFKKSNLNSYYSA